MHSWEKKAQRQNKKGNKRHTTHVTFACRNKKQNLSDVGLTRWLDVGLPWCWFACKNKKKQKFVSCGVWTHAWINISRPERDPLDRSGKLTIICGQNTIYNGASDIGEHLMFYGLIDVDVGLAWWPLCYTLCTLTTMVFRLVYVLWPKVNIQLYHFLMASMAYMLNWLNDFMAKSQNTRLRALDRYAIWYNMGWLKVNV